MFTVFAISSTHRKYIYVGMTTNLEQRFMFHNADTIKQPKPTNHFPLFTLNSLKLDFKHVKEKSTSNQVAERNS